MRGAALPDLTGGAETSPSAGTRFRVFPQAPFVSGYDEPETIWISTPPGSIGPGPEDRRTYVVDPILDKEPYEYPYLPPFVGAAFPPVTGGPDGHFDHIDRDARQFLSAHAFACVSRVLDIWESYLGGPFRWYFGDTYERLEIVPYVDWENAQSGYGFLELGRERGEDGRDQPYALNFDVIAHEVGHAILFSVSGVPETGIANDDFAPFHEASSDLVSLLSFLHFDSGLDRLLRHSQGNLLVLNELNRIAEQTGSRQIRLASNQRRMSETSDEVHDRSRPFTGAVFDAMIETCHSLLVEEGFADRKLLSVDLRGIDGAELGRLSSYTAQSFRSRPVLFKSALERARDAVGLCLAGAWQRLDPDTITFDAAAMAMIDACHGADPVLARRLEACFAWREIL